MIEAKPENLIGDRAHDSDPLDDIMRGTSACRAKRGTPGAIFDIVSWDVAADGVGHAARTFRSTNVEESASS
jgi:hypothetical protein